MESLSTGHRGTAHTFVRIDFHQLIIWIAFYNGCEVLDLHLKTADLCFFSCADTAVCGNTHLGGLLIRILLALRHNHTAFALTTAVFCNGLLYVSLFLLPAAAFFALVSGTLDLLSIQFLCHYVASVFMIITLTMTHEPPFRLFAFLMIYHPLSGKWAKK